MGSGTQQQQQQQHEYERLRYVLLIQQIDASDACLVSCTINTAVLLLFSSCHTFVAS